MDESAPRWFSEAGSPWRHCVFWLGLGAVLVFTLLADPAARPMPDEPDYIRLGRALAGGEGFVWGEHPAVKRAPGYPAYLAIIFWLWGPDALGAASVVQGLIMVVVAGSCMPAILRAFGFESTGAVRIGLGLVVLNPLLLWAATRIYPTALCTALVMGLAWAWLRPSLGRGLMAGLMMAALVHMRPAYILLPPFALGLQLILQSRAWPRRGLVPLLVFGIAIAPWAIRTSLLTGRPSAMAVSGFGNNLLYGAFEYRDLGLGFERFLGRARQGEAEPGRRPENDIRPEAFFEAQTEILAQASGEPNSPRWFANLDRLRMKRGWEELEQHPGAWALATLIRSIKLWVGVFEQGWPRWATVAARLGCLLALVLGAVGLVGLVRRRAGALHLLAPILYLALIHPPLHTEGRYSYPVRPIAVPVVMVGAVIVLRRRMP